VAESGGYTRRNSTTVNLGPARLTRNRDMFLNLSRQASRELLIAGEPTTHGDRTTRQIDLFCAPQPKTPRVQRGVQNGESCAPFSGSAVAPHRAFREQDAHPGQLQPALGRDIHDPASDCCPKCPTPGRPVSVRRSPLQSIFHGPALTPKTNCNIFRRSSSCASCAPTVPVFTGT
jgi:hypothetical protein